MLKNTAYLVGLAIFYIRMGQAKGGCWKGVAKSQTEVPLRGWVLFRAEVKSPIGVAVVGWWKWARLGATWSQIGEVGREGNGVEGQSTDAWHGGQIGVVRSYDDAYACGSRWATLLLAWGGRVPRGEMSG